MSDKNINILTKTLDWNQKEESFLSPSLSDALAGLHEVLTAAFWHEVNVIKETSTSDVVEVRLYKVETEDTDGGIKVVGQQIKLFEGKLEFWPKRLKDVPLLSAPEPEIPTEDIVTLN